MKSKESAFAFVGTRTTSFSTTESIAKGTFDTGQPAAFFGNPIGGAPLLIVESVPFGRAT